MWAFQHDIKRYQKSIILTILFHCVSSIFIEWIFPKERSITFLIGPMPSKIKDKLSLQYCSFSLLVLHQLLVLEQFHLKSLTDQLG